MTMGNIDRIKQAEEDQFPSDWDEHHCDDKMSSIIALRLVFSSNSQSLSWYSQRIKDYAANSKIGYFDLKV